MFIIIIINNYYLNLQEVWYLKPMHRYENESSINFANRVKAAIARQGGLVDLDWDGSLKRYSKNLS